MEKRPDMKTILKIFTPLLLILMPISCAPAAQSQPSPSSNPAEATGSIGNLIEPQFFDTDLDASQWVSVGTEASPTQLSNGAEAYIKNVPGYGDYLQVKHGEGVDHYLINIHLYPDSTDNNAKLHVLHNLEEGFQLRNPGENEYLQVGVEGDDAVYWLALVNGEWKIEIASV